MHTPLAYIRYLSITLGAVVLALLTACTCTSPSQAKWVQQQGGVVADSHQQRADAAVKRLLARRQPSERIGVQVLNSETISACVWPNRRVFITRGLMDRLTDDELAAALSHEIGHLLDDGNLRSMVALRGLGPIGGAGAGADHEVQADTFGCGLLESAGIPRAAMISMLEKVRAAHGDDPYLREGLDQRLIRLHATLDP
jgi:predicted Zn-dependent protease